MQGHLTATCMVLSPITAFYKHSLCLSVKSSLVECKGLRQNQIYVSCSVYFFILYMYTVVCVQICIHIYIHSFMSILLVECNFADKNQMYVSFKNILQYEQVIWPACYFLKKL